MWSMWQMTTCSVDLNFLKPLKYFWTTVKLFDNRYGLFRVVNWHIDHKIESVWSTCSTDQICKSRKKFWSTTKDKFQCTVMIFNDLFLKKYSIKRLKLFRKWMTKKCLFSILDIQY